MRDHMRKDQRDPKRPPLRGTEAEECNVAEVSYMRELWRLFSVKPIIWSRLVLFSFSCRHVHLWSHQLCFWNRTYKSPHAFPCSQQLHDSPGRTLLPEAISWIVVGVAWHLKTGSVAFPVCSHSQNHLSKTFSTELPATPWQVLFFPDFNSRY